MFQAVFSEKDLKKGVDISEAFSLVKKEGTSISRGSVSALKVDEPSEIRVKSGHPLHISWTTFYTGKITNRKGFNKQKNRPVLLTSALKKSSDAKPAQRAFLASWEESKDCEELFPEATASGASVLYFSKNIQQGLTVSIDLFEKPKKTKAFDNISEGLKLVAKFPPLAFTSGFLLIGSTVSTFVGNIIDELESVKKLFSASHSVHAAEDYALLSEPRYIFFCSDQTEMEKDLCIQLSDSGKPHLRIKGSSEIYKGTNAYVICRFEQKSVEGLLDSDIRAEALSLLEGWKPNEQGLDVFKLLSTLESGIASFS